jgi:hypothetical protein
MTDKRKITELLRDLQSACERNLIDSIEHSPEWYQIHVLFPQRQPQDMRERLASHIRRTYRDIVRVETSHPSSILIEYQI